MANNIITAEKYAGIVDAAYKKASLTAILDSATKLDFSGAKTVKVMKVETSGLGDYSKQNGYAKGNVSVTWEDMTLTEDRSAELEIDRMDDEETLGMAVGAATKDFMQMNVGPEVDAYRFMKYAKAAGIGSAAGSLADGSAVVSALRAATTGMDEDEVPNEDRVLFITPTLYGSVQDLDTNKSREVLKRFSTIVEVPQTRFYTDITLNSGADSWGYTKGAGAKNINFIVVSKSAIVQATKLALPKIFDPDTNQNKDAWKFQYRLYHDAFVYEKKAKGIYLHSAE